MQLLIPAWDGAPANVGAMTTLRQGGSSLPPYDDGQGGGGLNLGVHVHDAPEHVQENRRLLRSLLPSEPAWLTQVHGIDVVDAANAHDAPMADGCVASQPGVVCVTMTADCLPVLFCDTGGRVVGAAHAGWRGLVAGILERTVAAMRQRGATDLLAWLGPAIGPQQFEVGQEVLDAFMAHDAASESGFTPVVGRDRKYLADMYHLARLRLATAGVLRVSGGGLCTVSERRFYSYRRDKTTGRMASLIWLR